MTRTLYAIGLAVVMAAGAPGGARAAEEAAEKCKLEGLYGTLGGVWSNATFDVPSLVNVQDSWGLDSRLGYAFHENLAAEFQYQWAARYESTLNGQSIGTVATHAATVNLKAGLGLLKSPFQPYALLGVGLINGALRPGRDATEFGLRVGGGLQWYVTRHVGIYGELTYLQPFGSLRDYSAVPIAFGVALRP